MQIRAYSTQRPKKLRSCRSSPRNLLLALGVINQLEVPGGSGFGLRGLRFGSRVMIFFPSFLDDLKFRLK